MFYYYFHVVRPGETLNSIARSYNIPLYQLLVNNPQIINPDLIYPGQIIDIIVPDEPYSWFHYVRPGETLLEIASRYGIPLNLLLSWNGSITNPNLIYPGMKILISEIFD